MSFGRSSRVRVLRVITRLNIGGPAQHVAFLTERLNGGVFSTSLVAGSLGHDEGDMSPMVTGRGIPVTFLPALSNARGLLDDVRALAQLYRLMRKERPTIVHLHLFKARCLGGIAAKLAGVPLVVETLHGHLLSSYYGPLKTRLILAIEQFIGHWIADGIVAISERQRQELTRRRIAKPSKIHVVPLGLELERFLDAPRYRGGLRRELGIGADVFLVGAVGRLVPIKGYGVLLRAMREAADAIRGPIMLVIVGDGPLRKDLEAEAERLQLDHLVRFLGWRDDLDRLYADFDIFVQPSLNEGTPVSLIEAMAAGKPVVASRVGGVPDVVDDGRSGILVPPRDPAALARAVLQLWGEPGLRHHLGNEARRAVHPHYTVERLVSQLADLYLQLLTAKLAAPDQYSQTAGK